MCLIPQSKIKLEKKKKIPSLFQWCSEPATCRSRWVSIHVCGLGSKVNSVSWRLVQGHWRGLSGCWIWHYPWLWSPGQWGPGWGPSPPGCEACWRAGRDVCDGRPRWTSVSCDHLLLWGAAVRRARDRLETVDFTTITVLYQKKKA